MRRTPFSVPRALIAAALVFVAAEGERGAHAVPVSPAPSSGDAAAAPAFEAGRRALERGDFGAARDAFEAVLRIAPDHVPALLGLAEVAHRQSRTEDARAQLDRARAEAPESADVEVARARFFASQGEVEPARQALEHAVALAPEAVVPRVELGVLYANSVGDQEKAVETLRAAVALDETHAGAHFALGSVLTRTGAFEEAEAELSRAADLDPENALPWDALGRLHMARDDADEALQSFGRALEIDRGFVPARLARGDIYAGRGDLERALVEYEAANAAAPDSAEALVRLGMAHQELGRLDMAEESYRAAIARDDGQLVAYNNLAMMATERGADLDEAIAWARRAATLAPGAAAIADTLGWVHYARGEYDEALSVLEPAAEREPPNPELLYHLGVVYGDLNRDAEAQRSFTRALELAPGAAWAADARAWLDRLR